MPLRPSRICLNQLANRLENETVNSIWLSLLWKEWREYRWKLAALTTFVLLVVAVSILIALDGYKNQSWWLRISNYLGMYPVLLLAYGFLAGFFLSMSVAAKEDGDGTAPFLHSLPAAGWKFGSAKLIMASLTATLPIFIGTIISYFYIRSYFHSSTEYEYFFFPKLS